MGIPESFDPLQLADPGALQGQASAAARSADTGASPLRRGCGIAPGDGCSWIMKDSWRFHHAEASDFMRFHGDFMGFHG